MPSRRDEIAVAAYNQANPPAPLPRNAARLVLEQETNAYAVLPAIFDQITAALARGERVELRGFGAFTARRRDARIGHNPRTGEAVSVTEKTRLFFKTGKELRGRLNRDGTKRRT